MAADIEKIKEAMGAGIDVSFDCAGFEKTMSTALGATRSGGRVCLVGMGHENMTLPLSSTTARLVNKPVFTLFKINTQMCHSN